MSKYQGIFVKINDERLCIADMLRGIDKDNVVEGDLDLSALPLAIFKDDVMVFGDLDINSCADLYALSCRTMTVLGSVNMAGSKISKLPKNLIVGEDLLIFETRIRSIPKTVRVGGKIIVDSPAQVKCPAKMRHKLTLA